MNELDKILEKHDLRKTEVRRLVLQVFKNKSEAISSQDIEKELSSLDRITLYRTLKSFEEKGLIHRALDGSDKVKYAICQSGCSVDTHKDNHAHFHCQTCGKTLCLEKVISPKVSVPKGMQVHSSYLVLEGECQSCGAG